MTNCLKLSIVVTALLALNFVSATIQAQDASPSASPSPSATAAPTPIALDQVPSEAESAFSELHQIEDTLSKARAALESTNVGLTNLKAEVKARMAEGCENSGREPVSGSALPAENDLADLYC